MKLVILDRDGVINEDSDSYIKSEAEWQALPGSIEAIAHLHDKGWNIVVVTNQSGLGRGLFSQQDLDAMHNKLNKLVESAGARISGIFYCQHHPNEQCECRKPKVGLLEQVESSLNCSVAGAPFIGDSLKDLQTAEAKNCKPMLVKTGKGLETLETIRMMQHWNDLLVFDNLLEASNFIITSN